MDQFEFDALATAAFKGERVAARRLVARTHVTEAQALLQVLTLAAGAAGLAQLLSQREQLRSRDEERRLARQANAARKLALRKAGTQSTAAWRGWFDGSAHPNPGQIGIGALLCGPDGQRAEISRRAGYGNSSEAEYLALTALLELAVRMGATELAVCGDSQVVVNDVNLGAARGAKGLEPHRARVGELMSALGAVQLRWVPRHRNGDADRLSQQAVAGHAAAD